MLHPTLGEKYLPKDEITLPEGFMTLNSMLQYTKRSNNNSKNDLGTVKKNRVKVDPKYYSRFKEFKKMPPSNFEVPIIRNSSPYVNLEEDQRREELVSPPSLNF